MAGLRAAALLANAAAAPADAQHFSSAADKLFAQYQKSNYTADKNDYFNYCTLWPTRLFPLTSGPISAGFRSLGQQMPDTWLYFPLATAHQGLLAGSRPLGYQTLDTFLADDRFKVGDGCTLVSIRSRMHAPIDRSKSLIRMLSRPKPDGYWVRRGCQDARQPQTVA